MRALETRLVEDVRALRQVDPAGTVLLLVPSRLLGVHLRRRLAQTLGGVAGLQVLTLPDLAERLAALPMSRAGRRPLPPVADRLLLGRAIRTAVPVDGGYFSAVSALPGFPAVLGGTLVDLKRASVTPDTLRQVARAGSSTVLDEASRAKIEELAVCYQVAEDTLRDLGYRDASDLLSAATREVEADPGCLGATAVLVFGFLELNLVERRLLEACARAVRLLTYGVEPDADIAISPPRAVEIVAAPGEEREVREIARVILGYAEGGGRFDEVGILLRQPGIYRAAIRDVFEAAGIPYTWGAPPTPGETRAGRTLRLLAEVRRSGFAREAVIECLAFADLRPGHGVIPAEWDRLARRAGIVQGAREWLARIDRLARGLAGERPASDGEARASDARPSETDDDADPLDERAEAARRRDLEALTALRRALRILVRGLGRLPDEGPIGELARRLAMTFRRLVAPSPEAGQVLGAMAGLGALADLEPRVTLDDFWTLLDDALAAPVEADEVAREGRVFVGDLVHALGLAFPLIVLPGLTEGGFPGTVREDPILLDEERRLLAGLPLAVARRRLDHLRFRLAVSSGASRLVLSYPRVDAESGRPRVPSSFLLDLVETLTGDRQDFESLERFPGWRWVPFQPAPPAAVARPVDEREWLVTRALAARDAPGRFLADCQRAVRGRITIECRERRSDLTVFDGLLDAGPALDDRPMVATWLERYATCPFRYFLGRVLGVSAVETPERILTLGPADRGSLVHQVFEATYRRLGDQGLLPITRARLADATAVLDQALDDGFGRVERQGVTGLPALWAGEQTRLRAECRAALAVEAEADPEAGAWRPALLEAAFGIAWRPESGPALDYVLPGGTTVRLAGLIDRVDLSSDGRRARVIDYKTGRLRGPARPNRLAGGRALQLPVYRLAAAALLEGRGTPADVDSAEYYHVIGRDAGRRVRFTRDGWAKRRDDFDRILALLVEGIQAGRFFTQPERCARRGPCSYDPACGAERLRWAEAKAHDPAARRHAELEEIE